MELHCQAPEPFAKLFCCILKIEALPDFMLRKRVQTRFF
jgi:hypothetical protein